MNLVGRAARNALKMNGKPSGSGIPASKAGGGQKPYLLERAG
tara:strand:- start:218 stop:343 length:126 start_codon:yes stop_codon:yes gene_type:complete